MNDKEKLPARLAPLESVDLSPADIEHVMQEAKDIERVIAELEEFARDIPWVSQQIQPSGTKAGS